MGAENRRPRLLTKSSGCEECAWTLTSRACPGADATGLAFLPHLQTHRHGEVVGEAALAVELLVVVPVPLVVLVEPPGLPRLVLRPLPLDAERRRVAPPALLVQEPRRHEGLVEDVPLVVVAQ